MFVNARRAKGLKKAKTWAQGVYVTEFWGPGYLVVLQGAGGGSWYPTKHDAETAAQRMNVELAEGGLEWVFEASP